jgi:hypothetical protein
MDSAKRVKAEIPAEVAHIFSYEKKMILFLFVVFFAVGWFAAPYAMKEYNLSESVFWIAIILISFQLSLSLASELSLRNFGVLVSYKRKEFTPISEASSPDDFKRLLFRQRLQAFLSLFLVLPATYFSLPFMLDNSQDLRKYCSALVVWGLLLFISKKVTDWISVQKFGEIEAKEQQEKKEETQKLVREMRGPDYKKRAYIRKLKAVFILVYMLLGLFLVSLAEQYGVPKKIIVLVSLALVLLLSEITARIVAEKKFPKTRVDHSEGENAIS